MSPLSGHQPALRSQERIILDRKRRIREVIFGLQDGLLSTLGILTGVALAGSSAHLILMTALVGAITGTIAMGVGEYLGAQAEARVLQATIDQERLLQQTAPQAEFLEQCQFLEAKGFTPEEAKQFTARLVQNPEHWLAEMVNDEYGIQIEDAQASQAVHGGLILGGAFGVGALLLIGTYMGMHDLPAVLLMAALALGTVGAISGWLSRSNPWLRAAELLFAGFILFDLTAGAGYLFTLF